MLAVPGDGSKLVALTLARSLVVVQLSQLSCFFLLVAFNSCFLCFLFAVLFSFGFGSSCLFFVFNCYLFDLLPFLHSSPWLFFSFLVSSLVSLLLLLPSALLLCFFSLFAFFWLFKLW